MDSREISEKVIEVDGGNTKMRNRLEKRIQVLQHDAAEGIEGREPSPSGRHGDERRDGALARGHGLGGIRRMLAVCQGGGQGLGGHPPPSLRKQSFCGRPERPLRCLCVGGVRVWGMGEDWLVLATLPRACRPEGWVAGFWPSLVGGSGSVDEADRQDGMEG